jgi:hypothetical protein
MMKKLFTLTLMAVGLALSVHAQENTDKSELPEWVKNIKLSAYGIVQYQGEDKEGAESNSFNLRLMRVILDGKIGDVAYRAQMQGTLNSGPGASSVFLNDLYAEWQKYDFLRVKVGQFKRAFTFENPTHPITQGWYSYALVVNSLAGLGDRTGEKSSGGRDIGLQIQGDLLKNAAGRNLLHYQVGVYNGDGINTKDKDNKKDIIGGVWVMPIKGMRIGAFGWTGTRYMATTQTVEGDIVNTKAESVRKNRYALSAEYALNDWTARAEYIHSQGFAANKDKGDKADGWYALAIAPVIKNKMHVKARYDCYRDQKTWASSKTYYEVGADYLLSKNLQVNVEYARVNERATHSNYNLVDVELDFRF